MIGVILILIASFLPCYEPFGFGGSSEPLYSLKDKGITLVNVSNFTQTILQSDHAWMVEFYSSWCGHCIRFAPVYKELGLAVEGWQSMIKLAAIDCAQDENVATCRDYEIMGYPSLKFFPPKAAKTEVGFLRESYDKEIPHMMTDMAKYVESVYANASFNSFWTQHNWPNLDNFKSDSLSSLWPSDNVAATDAILITEPDDSPVGIYVIMEVHNQMKNNVLVRRRKTTDSSSLVISYLQKGQEKSAQPLYQTTNPSEFSWQDLRQVLHQALTRNLASSAVKEAPEGQLEGNSDDTAPVVIEAEIKRRRYTAFMSDIENAILYSLTHEVGSHGSITGKSLEALRNYVNVLDSDLPGRSDTMTFMHQLHKWVVSHDDIIRGEDLIAEINDLRASTGAFVDTPNGNWIGCRGSKPIYGGYPCSLWTLWHTLTVNQKSENPRQVLEAMVGYVTHFFGCQDCVRHFLLVATEDSLKAIQSKKDAILWLWWAHNKANVRLTGDLTDDKAFPKHVFPDKMHCSDCYTNRLGTDLWNEFNHEKIVEFLTNLYGEDEISGRGLRVFANAGHLNHDHHEMTVYKEDKRHLKNEFNQESIWNPLDFGLCFSIYLLSAIILLIVYFKFIAKKNLCYSIIYRLTNSAPTSQNGMRNVV